MFGVLWLLHDQTGLPRRVGIRPTSESDPDDGGVRSGHCRQRHGASNEIIVPRHLTTPHAYRRRSCPLTQNDTDSPAGSSELLVDLRRVSSTLPARLYGANRRRPGGSGCRVCLDHWIVIASDVSSSEPASITASETTSTLLDVLDVLVDDRGDREARDVDRSQRRARTEGDSEPEDDRVRDDGAGDKRVRSDRARDDRVRDDGARDEHVRSDRARRPCPRRPCRRRPCRRRPSRSRRP